MSKSLRILQVACYRGNIGDNANIAGTRAMLAETLGCTPVYTDADILDYLWGEKRFDDEFVKLANTHDLVIVGGGGFFELVRDDTCTGTPLDMNTAMLERIRPPVVFHALGVDAAKGAPEARVQKFRRFMDYLLASERTLVSVRNDGALQAVRELLGDSYAAQIPEIPDGGFFVPRPECAGLPGVTEGRPTVAVNLAGDMLDVRFPDAAPTGEFTFPWTLVRRDKQAAPTAADHFLGEFAKSLRSIAERRDDVDILLVPHMHKDLEIQGALASRLGSRLARRRLNTAPYVQGLTAHESILGLYRRCSVILGMRFHANVCGIGLGIPTVGLVCYPQIRELYRNVGIEERAVDVATPGFGSRLERLVNDSLDNRDAIAARYAEIVQALRAPMQDFHRRIRDMLKARN